MSGKHAKKEKKSKSKFLIIFIILIILVLLALLIKLEWGKHNKLEDDINIELSNINNQTTIENEKLVLKSNYEENREKRIIYNFKNDKVDKITVYEKYENKDLYENQKESYNGRTDIRVNKIDDENLQICYEKIDFRTDEGLSYEEIYKKYIGIIGAYEVL